MSESLSEISKALEDAQACLKKAQMLMRELNPEEVSEAVAERVAQVTTSEDDGTKEVIEGVFDGWQMIGPDGTQYPVPANYASKSKLVEGDMLKLRVQHNGTFLYKQIGPVERTRLKGVLLSGDNEGDFRVLAGGRSYRILTASVTYYKGAEGDEACIQVPADADSHWAALENIISGDSANLVPDLPIPEGEEGSGPIQLLSHEDAEEPTVEEIPQQGQFN